jgi:Ca2+-binding RTX toxin-like protein
MRCSGCTEPGASGSGRASQGGNDARTGGEGRDRPGGGSGLGNLTGGAEDDVLAGNAGRDVLNRGDGNDTLTGDAIGREAMMPLATGPVARHIIKGRQRGSR